MTLKSKFLTFLSLRHTDLKPIYGSHVRLFFTASRVMSCSNYTVTMPPLGDSPGLSLRPAWPSTHHVLKCCPGTSQLLLGLNLSVIFLIKTKTYWRHYDVAYFKFRKNLLKMKFPLILINIIWKFCENWFPCIVQNDEKW